MSAPAPHPEPSPRPRQMRSQEVVEAIVRAGRELLAEQGPGGLTTARIVERAGVSIGSLYRNFANKEAVVAAIHASQPLTDESTEATGSIDDGPLHRVLSVVVDLALSNGPRALSSPEAESRMRGLLERHTAIVRVRDLDQAAFLMARGLSAIVERAHEERPEKLGEPGFRLELIDLLSCYLTSEQQRL
jgi:AcrR family transcriptional regulator